VQKIVLIPRSLTRGYPVPGREWKAATAPEHQLVDADDIGALAAFLVSDCARRITGTIIPVDGGQHVIM